MPMFYEEWNLSVIMFIAEETLVRDT